MKEQKNESISIPIFLDDVKQLEEFEMARFNYLSIEADESQADWRIMLGSLKIPVFISGLTAAICQPSQDKIFFDSIADLDGLFDLFETEMGLMIETPDIWIPNMILPPLENLRKGDVFRIDQLLLHTALLFRSGRSERREFVETCSGLSIRPKYSARETSVFAEWNLSQIEAAKAFYAEKSKENIFMEYT